MKVAFNWLNTLNERVTVQQNKAIVRIITFGHEPVIFTDNDDRQFLSNMLTETSKLESSGFFAWLNNDCVPLIDFSLLATKNSVVGLKRIESNGEICGGVDGYIFDINIWNDYYLEDIPKLYIGATHIDWWVTRLAQKHNFYKEISGLFHVSHPKTESSLGIDKYGVHNINEYIAWAKRHNISTE